MQSIVVIEYVLQWYYLSVILVKQVSELKKKKTLLQVKIVSVDEKLIESQ